MLRSQLTLLEYERLGLLALGWRHRDIAQFTNGTELSVRQAFHHTLTKTGASDKLELANRFAREVFMGYDVESAGSSTGQSNSFLKNRLRVRVPSRAPVTSVIYSAHLRAASLASEDLCEL